MTAALAGGPRLLPARADPVSAADLLVAAQGSTQHYSGVVETRGTLGLPLTDQFTDLADLFGQQTRMRVWWRGADDWRVDQLSTTGETDLIHDSVGTTSWDYEANRATRTGPAVVRLPQGSDLLPPALGHLMLETATASQVTRLEARRVAGISAPGLRFRPRDPRTSIARVDIWVEPRTGLPLQVEVYAAGVGPAALTSSFESVSLREPAATTTAFTPAPGARTRFEEVTDLAAAANAYAPVIAPATLSGLTRRDAATGAVGIYGRGVTELMAIPLRGQVAGPLRQQLDVTAGVTSGPAGRQLAVRPLNLLLTAPTYTGRSWLLAGTVTPELLAAAAAEVADRQLPANPLAAQP